jgi:UDP-glucuronate decarboxylase
VNNQLRLKIALRSLLNCADFCGSKLLAGQRPTGSVPIRKGHPMSFSRIRTLVTGGSGFIGSHLCERLLAEGREVLCVDNYYTGRRQNIEHLLANPRFEVMRHDITLSLYVEVDEIYNLA